MAMMQARCFVGTSGYSYSHWKDGVFYPYRLRASKWLEYYAGIFNTVELNVTFYRLPQPVAFEGWYKRTPKQFLFSVKGSRFITHRKRLKDCEHALKLFFRSILPLKHKVSCILWQLPPKFKIDRIRLASFIGSLAKMSKGRDMMRYVFEFRHESWYQNGIFSLLKDNNISLCIADRPTFASVAPQTADFIYMRRHGTGAHLYDGCYSAAQLKKDASFIKRATDKHNDVYIYFNNDIQGYAPKNALTLKGLLEEKDVRVK